MTAEQLEELSNGFATHLHSEETIHHLARRVLAAEKLAEAVDGLLHYEISHVGPNAGQCAIATRSTLTAYREASK